MISGLSIAQSFLANSATRTHPVQWSIGTASGAAAAYMALSQVSSTAEALAHHLIPMQRLIGRFQPLSWTVGDLLLPPPLPSA